MTKRRRQSDPKSARYGLLKLRRYRKRNPAAIVMGLRAAQVLASRKRCVALAPDQTCPECGTTREGWMTYVLYKLPPKNKKKIPHPVILTGFEDVYIPKGRG